MNLISREILNSICCPICKSPIDLLDWSKIRSMVDAVYNFSCVIDYTHYKLFFNHWYHPPTIEYENVLIYEKEYLYSIIQHANRTKILTFSIDQENRIIDQKIKKPTFIADKKLFDFSNSNRDKILNRIKTILVFQ